MKRKISKIMCGILLLVSVLSGCSSDSKNILINEKPDPTAEIISTPEISEPFCIEIYLPERGGHEMSDSLIKKWEEYVGEVSGEKISIEYTTLPYIDVNNANKTALDKLIYVGGSMQLQNLIAKDMIIPLNQYLENIQGANIIDESSYEDFTDENGNIWALPSYSKKVQYGYRYYSKEWLSILGAEVPVTIDEFTELASLIRSQELVKNKKETYIAEIRSYESIMNSFLDVFLSFGCRPSLFSFQNISYDDVSGKYEDIALKSQFREALEYIKYMVDNDLIIKTIGLNSDVKTERYIIGLEAGASKVKGFFLEGSNKDGLIYETSNSSGFAVLKDCRNIEKQLSFLINRAFVEEELLEAFNLGIKGVHFDETDEYYTYFLNADNTMINGPEIRINLFMDIRESKPFLSPTSDYEASKKIYFENLERISLENTWLENLRKTDEKKFHSYEMTKEVSPLINGIANDDIRLFVDINTDFINIFTDVFEKGESVENAVEAYKLKYEKKGYGSLIDRLNVN